MNKNENALNIIKGFSQKIGLDFDLIKRIQIVIYDKSYAYMGKINPITINREMFFELILQQAVLNDLLSEDENKIKVSQNIILHELFHCKEMITTSLYVDFHKLYFHTPITTTRLLLLDTAVQQWSEYYAYYHSSKTYERDIIISDYISSANASLKVLHDKLIETHNMSEIQILYSFITNLIDFIHICIILIANYNATYNKKYKKEFDSIKRSGIYGTYYPYLKDLLHYMNDLLTSYPKWVSESAFIELGYKLFSFIHINKLTFTTNDLSDNFMLKLI